MTLTNLPTCQVKALFAAPLPDTVSAFITQHLVEKLPEARMAKNVSFNANSECFPKQLNISYVPLATCSEAQMVLCRGETFLFNCTQTDKKTKAYNGKTATYKPFCHNILSWKIIG